MSDNVTINKVINNIAQSKKYRSVYEKTIERVVRECWDKYDTKLVEKKARNLLHQIWGAYWETRPDFQKLFAKIQNDINSGEDIQKTIFSLLPLQSSTKERIPILDQFYKKIFAITGQPESIIDHACGLNPLTIFWMDLPPTTIYQAFDIDKEQIMFLRNLFQILPIINPVNITLGDILADATDYADVVFMLKLLPCLEHQKKNSALEVLQAQPCKYLVVSYPVKSIIGIDKGMADFYTTQFITVIANQGWSYEKILFDTELVFVIKK